MRLVLGCLLGVYRPPAACATATPRAPLAGLTALIFLCLRALALLFGAAVAVTAASSAAPARATAATGALARFAQVLNSLGTYTAPRALILGQDALCPRSNVDVRKEVLR